MDPDYGPVDVYRKVLELIDAGTPFAVAVIFRAEGSTPQRAGVRAVVEETGKIWGTLGGGLVEAETRRRAVEACRSGRPVPFDFQLDNASASDEGQSAGGPCGSSSTPRRPRIARATPRWPMR